jgi:hypothetical protein
MIKNTYVEPTGNDILRGIESKIVASCECLTKTPDHQYHAKDCLYRILCETGNYIRMKLHEEYTKAR